MSKTILCVDDSVTMQKVAQITFEASNYTYVGARNADEGLAAAKDKQPILILADAVMPGKTGYDLCKAVKADPALAGIPVLILCGNSQAYDTARGTSAGADGHIAKPWDTQVMLDRVAEILDAAKSQPKKPAGIVTALGATPAAPAVKPSMPSIKTPEPPRSATIMGMPSLKLPATPSERADFGAAKPVARPAPMKPAPVKKPAAAPVKKPVAAPVKKPVAAAPVKKPAAAAPVKKPAAAAPVKIPAPVVSRPRTAPPVPQPIHHPPMAARSEKETAKPIAPGPVSAKSAVPTPTPVPRAPSAGMPRPPMIKGIPRRRPESIAFADSERTVVNTSMTLPEAAIPPQLTKSLSAKSNVATRASVAATSISREVAADAGLDPAGPEFAALVALSREVVERVVWEVVPELAETLIQEHIAKNGIS